MKSMLKKRVLAMMVAIPMILATACNSKSGKNSSKDSDDKQALDITQYVSVSAKGIDGMGIVNCDVNTSGISKTLKNTMKELFGENPEPEIKKAYSDLEKSISFQAVPSTDVKNGDEVEIKVVFSKEKAELCSVEFSPDSIKFSVSGLQSIQTVDAFEGLKVTFSGSEEKTEIILDNSGCSDFVKNYVLFSIYEKKDAYKNGESVTIMAEMGSNLPDEYKGDYILASYSKEYIADGLDKYPSSIDNLDAGEVVKMAYDKGTSHVSDIVYNKRNYPEINGTAKFENSYTISDYKMIPEKIYYLQPKENTDAQGGIVVLFHLTYTISGNRYLSSTVLTETVDSYVASGCFGFMSDSTQTKVTALGETVFLKNDTVKYIRNNHQYEECYNTFISPYADQYVINELDASKYASLFSNQ